jgi:hypothetical protein
MAMTPGRVWYRTKPPDGRNERPSMPFGRANVAACPYLSVVLLRASGAEHLVERCDVAPCGGSPTAPLRSHRPL